MLLQFLVLSAATAGSVAPAAAPPASTVQQAFDVASAAYEGEHWAEALAAFRALEARLTKSRTLAVIHVREGVALWRLGRNEDAVASLTDGLARLPAGDATLAGDSFQGYVALARAYEALNLPVDAVAAFAKAEQAATDDGARAGALAGSARIEAYLDPTRALAAIDKAIALSAGNPDKQLAGQMQTTRGRAQLDAGQFAAAGTSFDKAVSLLGGLTTKVSMSDIVARSDRAIAALLSGDDATAKKYLAYSASGNLEDGFARGANMAPPDCGATTGLRPDDVAVVEFGIAPDGTVSYASPVYASRPGPAVAEFGRAVSRWSWAPESLAKIPPLFRLLTRVELRCSTASDRPTIQTYLDGAVRDWFATRGLPTPKEAGVAAADLVMLRRELTERRAEARPPLELAPLLFEVARNGAAPSAERYAASADWSRAVLSADPPALVRVTAATAAAMTARPFRKNASMPAGTFNGLLADPVIAADPHAINALRLRIAEIAFDRRDYAEARPQVQAVVADARLGPTDPLRSAAMLRSSAIALALGDLPAARTAFEQSGVSEEQCALIDASPVVTRRAGDARDYPTEAINWHISGWAVTEFDIRADGSTSGVRTTVAYPPFVFGKATVKIYERTRYTQSYRPSGGLGCSGFRASQGYRVL